VIGFTATAPSVSNTAARSGLGLSDSSGKHAYDPDSDGAEGESDGQMLTSQRMMMEGMYSSILIWILPLMSIAARPLA
jgi:hypothetical protein